MKITRSVLVEKNIRVLNYIREKLSNLFLSGNFLWRPLNRDPSAVLRIMGDRFFKTALVKLVGSQTIDFLKLYSSFYVLEMNCNFQFLLFLSLSLQFWIVTSAELRVMSNLCLKTALAKLVRSPTIDFFKVFWSFYLLKTDKNLQSLLILSCLFSFREIRWLS